MNLYSRVVDRLDAFWEPHMPSRRKRAGKDVAPSVRSMALYLAGLPVGGFGLGAALINAMQARLRHDQLSFEFGMVGAIFAAVTCLSCAWIVLRFYARVLKSASV